MLINPQGKKFLTYCSLGILFISAVFLISLKILTPTFFPLIQLNLPEKTLEISKGIWAISMGCAMVLIATGIPLIAIFKREKTNIDTKKTILFFWGVGILVTLAGNILLNPAKETEFFLFTWKNGKTPEIFSLEENPNIIKLVLEINQKKHAIFLEKDLTIRLVNSEIIEKPLDFTKIPTNIW